MKNLIKEFLMGLLLFAVTLIIELAVSIILNQPDPTKISEKEIANNVNIMFQASAVPIGLAAFAFAAILKPADQNRAIRMSIIWTAIFVFLNVLTGLGNNTMNIIFSGIGFYVSAILMLAGPIIFNQWKKRRK